MGYENAEKLPEMAVYIGWAAISCVGVGLVWRQEQLRRVAWEEQLLQQGLLEVCVSNFFSQRLVCYLLPHLPTECC